MRAKVSEGPSIASPAFTALGIMCSEGAIPTGATADLNASLGLDAAGNYANTGKYVNSVLASNSDASNVRVVIQYNAIGSAVSNNQTVQYDGACLPTGLKWTISGTVNSKYWPKN